jgi:hypothetical protein
MKKKIYYASFVLLGAIIGFFLHEIIEFLYIILLLWDFDKYGLGLSWATWQKIHNYGTILLVFGFAILGYRLGVKYWRILYVEQKYSKWLGKLKTDF